MNLKLTCSKGSCTWRVFCIVFYFREAIWAWKVRCVAKKWFPPMFPQVEWFTLCEAHVSYPSGSASIDTFPPGWVKTAPIINRSPPTKSIMMTELGCGYYTCKTKYKKMYQSLEALVDPQQQAKQRRNHVQHLLICVYTRQTRLYNLKRVTHKIQCTDETF